MDQHQKNQNFEEFENNNNLYRSVVQLALKNNRYARKSIIFSGFVGTLLFAFSFSILFIQLIFNIELSITSIYISVLLFLLSFLSLYAVIHSLRLRKSETDTKKYYQTMSELIQNFIPDANTTSEADITVLTRRTIESNIESLSKKLNQLKRDQQTSVSQLLKLVLIISLPFSLLLYKFATLPVFITLIIIGLSFLGYISFLLVNESFFLLRHSLENNQRLLTIAYHELLHCLTR